jgi:hypothetical protein
MNTPIHTVEFPILAMTFWTWASIVGLSMTPNLVLGPRRRSAWESLPTTAHGSSCQWSLWRATSRDSSLPGLPVRARGSVSSAGGSRGCTRRGPRRSPTCGESGAASPSAAPWSARSRSWWRSAGWALTCAGFDCRWPSATRSLRSFTTRSSGAASTSSQTSETTLRYRGMTVVDAARA